MPLIFSAALKIDSKSIVEMIWWVSKQSYSKLTPPTYDRSKKGVFLNSNEYEWTIEIRNGRCITSWLYTWYIEGVNKHTRSIQGILPIKYKYIGWSSYCCAHALARNRLLHPCFGKIIIIRIEMYFLESIDGRLKTVWLLHDDSH